MAKIHKTCLIVFFAIVGFLVFRVCNFWFLGFLPPELLAFLVFLVLIFWSPFFRKCRFVIYPGHSMNYRFFR